MRTHIEELLAASLRISELRKQLAAKEALIEGLRRDLGLLRLWRDLQSDFDLSADAEPVSMFHRPQI
jgi:hypothetical protein